MPPEEKKGDLPTSPDASPEVNPNISPVADPAPVTPAPGPAKTTNPAAGEATTPTLGTPDAAPSDGKNPLGKLNKRSKLIGIVAAIILVLLAAALLLPFSPFAILKNGPPKGPKLTVGDKTPFVYSCGVFDAQTVGKELELNLDASKQGAEETFSFDPSNTTDKSVDLLKHTGDKTATSSCTRKFDRSLGDDEDGRQTVSFINVTLLVEQYPGEKEATDQFNERKNNEGDEVKTLASYGDSSYYLIPEKSRTGPTYVQPVVKYKHMLLYFTAPLKTDDEKAEKMTAQLDKVVQDVLKRIDKKQGEKPTSFNAVAKLGKSKFVDACQSVNYRQFAHILGGEVQFDPTSFTASQNFAPNDVGGKLPNHLTSVCGFNFRTKADADAAATQRPKLPTDMSLLEESAYKSRYPHFTFLQILTAENKENAQKIYTELKKSGEGQPNQPKIEDLQIGDMAFKVETPHDESNPYDNKLYYITKDARTYLLSISYKRQSQPFKTTDQSVSDDQAKQLFNLLTAASSYAQRQ